MHRVSVMSAVFLIASTSIVSAEPDAHRSVYDDAFPEEVFQIATPLGASKAGYEAFKTLNTMEKPAFELTLQEHGAPASVIERHSESWFRYAKSRILRGAVGAFTVVTFGFGAYRLASVLLHSRSYDRIEAPAGPAVAKGSPAPLFRAAPDAEVVGAALVINPTEHE